MLSNSQILLKKEVMRMDDVFLSIVVSVAAEVIAYFICKWLDNSNRK